MSWHEPTKDEVKDLRRELKKIIKPGDTIWTIVGHVNRSGTSRYIKSFVIHKGRPFVLDWYFWKLGLGERDNKHEGLKVGGCGMDMGFHLVYSFARRMYPHGHNCAGEGKCRSNEHTNGDWVYDRRKRHSDGGYAYEQRWL